MNTLNEIAQIVNKNAHDKGFYDKNLSEDHYIEAVINNLHDELSELHESYRENRLREPCDKAEKMKELGLRPLTCLEEELSDVIIRVCDNAHHLGVNIQEAVEIKHAYNKTRPYRHGNKRS